MDRIEDDRQWKIYIVLVTKNLTGNPFTQKQLWLSKNECKAMKVLFM